MIAHVPLALQHYKMLAGVILSRSVNETTWAQKGPKTMRILDTIAEVMGSKAFLLFVDGCIAIFFIAQIVGK